LGTGSAVIPEQGAGTLAGRSARAQARIARRVAELERNRHVGVLVAWRRRYDEIRGYELAAAIGVALFTTVLPLILIGFAWAESFKSNRSSADLVIRQFNLHSETARVVRDTFSSASSERSDATVLGLFSILVGGVPLAGFLARAFAMAWRVPEHSFLRGAARGGAWFVLYMITLGVTESARYSLAREGIVWTLAAAVVTLGVTFGLWLVTPRLLLARDLGGWRALVPTAVAGTVLTVVVVLLGHVVVPYWLSQWTQSFGGIGVAFAFITFIVLVAVSWVMVATFGAVYWERTADPELVAADQMTE
jgi:hypothetical protein